MSNGNNQTYEYLITELYKERWKDENITFRDVLRKLRYEEKMSYRKIAKHFKVSLSTVYMWCKREDILEKNMKW